jgi:hypothetical protein
LTADAAAEPTVFTPSAAAVDADLTPSTTVPPTDLRVEVALPTRPSAVLAAEEAARSVGGERERERREEGGR